MLLDFTDPGCMVLAMNVAAMVAATKRRHPERYCPTARCLWRTGGGACPRHADTERPARDGVRDAAGQVCDTLDALWAVERAHIAAMERAIVTMQVAAEAHAVNLRSIRAMLFEVRK